ncbi:MAG: autotransporter outer membrane beta-barrel domain-containing protein [Alphaproteobacteria bacterium]|nr:autotransporter outer membrane beta-barrel domain-containing protein [Alphaproteobacteria bacterium]
MAITTTSSDPVSGAFSVTVTFSEAVSGFVVGDLSVGNGAASNLQTSDNTVFTADITPSSDGSVTVDVAAGAAQDAAGNDNTAATQFSIESDGTAPGVSIATTSSDPVSGVFSVTVTFTEAVTGFAVGDIAVGNGAADNFAGSGDTYTADITPASDGSVTVDVAAGVAQDAAGNDNTAAQFSIESDGTAPGVVLSVEGGGPISGAFTLTVTFDEDVTGLELTDLVLSNATVSDLAGGPAVYTVLVTPDADGDVTIDLAADVAQDAAGNGNSAAAQLVVGSDSTLPVLSIVLPGAEVEGAFTAQFNFAEDVTGFALEDIAVTNGAASDFMMESASAYTALITPDTLGDVVVSVAAGAAQDAAANDSLAASASIEAISRPVEVAITIADDVASVTEITGQAVITNPGSEAIQYRAEVDVPWLAVDPSSGTIPSLGDLTLTISVLESAEDLDPGTYTGTITIINEGAIAAPNKDLARAPGDTIVVEIPLTITLEERYGTVEIVSTTPGGAHRDAEFGLTSDDPDFNGLAIATSGGRGTTGAIEKLFGGFSVQQSVPAGWRINDVTCSGDSDGGSVIDLASGQATIDLDPGEAIICTFENIRDEDAVRLATMRAINNFLVRRADRILSSAPDLGLRLRERDTRSPGRFSADISQGRGTMSMETSLAGIRNHARDNNPQMPGSVQEQENLDIWFAANFVSLSDDRDGADVSSDFGVAQLGVDWMLDEQTLVGLMIQGDWMDEVTADIAEDAGAVRGARVNGSGWMAGPYLVREVGDGVILDVLALWGQSDNVVNPLGLYEDEFETSRYMLRANLSGEWRFDNWRIRPEAALAHFSETQDAYTDSLGFTIPEQTVSIGRFQAGPEFAYRWTQRDGSWWEPSFRLRGVWDYDAADLINEAGQLVGTAAGRADAQLGLRALLWHGAYLDVSGGVSGLGDGDFSADSMRFDVRLPF